MCCVLSGCDTGAGANVDQWRRMSQERPTAAASCRLWDRAWVVVESSRSMVRQGDVRSSEDCESHYIMFSVLTALQPSHRQQTVSELWWLSGGSEPVTLSELLCVVLCTAAVYSHHQSHMNSSYQWPCGWWFRFSVCLCLSLLWYVCHNCSFWFPPCIR